MSFPVIDASVKERVEMRSQMRNLDRFLDCSFAANTKLALVQDKVHGIAIDSFMEMDSRTITWKNFPSLWWNERLSLYKVVRFIAQKIPDWTQLLQQDRQKLVRLERQCAKLEKVVTKYNAKKAAGRKGVPISYVNPFKKTLKVNISHPIVVGESAKTTVVRDICYDRLTSAAELSAALKVAFEKPIVVWAISSSVHKADSDALSFNVVPKQLFKKVVQVPEVLFDPSDEQERESVQVLCADYDDYDVRILAGLIFDAGERQSLSRVYDRGFNAGKIVGFNEALSKMKTAFSG